MKKYFNSYNREYVVNYMIRNNIIEVAEKEIHAYGINLLIGFVKSVVTAFFIGVLFQAIWESILFTAAYIPLRRFAGGFHAKTEKRCYLYSTLLIICVILFIQYISFTKIAMILFLGFANITIFARSPMESENKPLSQLEKRIFRKKTIQALVMEDMIILISMIINQDIIANCFLWGVISTAVLIILPSIKYLVKEGMSMRDSN